MASSDPETKMDVDEHVVASYPGGDDDGSPVQETTLAETKEAKQEESNETMGAGKATKSDEQVASNSVDDDSPKKEITSAEESEKKMEAETDTKVDVELQGPSSSGGASAEKEITPTDESAKNIETEKAANTKADLKEQVARSSGDASAEKEIPPESAKKIETETFTDAKVDVEEQVSRSSSDDSPTKVMASLEDSEKEVRAETAELEKKMDTEKVTDTKMDIDEEDSSRSGGDSPTEETTPIKESKKKIEAKNSTATKDQTTTGADSPLCLHDCLSLGEIELGLIQSNRAVEEIQRLPLFLRVLSLTRPLASISILETDEDGNHGDGDGDSKKNDPLVNRVVERLEHVAATYSVAEGVDVLTCHLAPSVSRKISKLPPLQMKGSDWDTTALATVARNPRSNKRKRSKSVSNGDQAGPEQDDGIGGSWEEDDDEDGEEDAVADEDAAEHQSLPNTPAAKKQKALNRRDSMEVAAQDSLEATVTKTLSELASLVVTSLEPIADSHDTEEEQGGKGLSLTIDDSILSESAGGASQGAGGAMEGSDLGPTVSVIMHHAPVLRSKHVANALCRAAIPQAGNLLTRMGANCPASVPSLLLGCVEAYSLAISHGSASIANVAKKGATALAKLSRMECSRVQNKLMSLGVMLDVQLKLAMETDETAAACLLVENLADTENFPAASTSGTQGKEKDSTNETGSSSRQKLEQTTGDKPSDFRTRSNSTSIGKEPLLWQLLTSDMTLYKQALDFFVAFFSSLSTSAAKNVPIGKLCLLLRAFGWFLFVPVKQNTKIKPSVYFFETIFPALGSLFGRLKKMVPQDDELQAKSPLDDALALLQCTFMLTSARILSSGGNTEEVTKKVKGMMEIMHGFPSVSLTSDGSRFILKCAANNGNTLGIYIHIINVFSTIETQDADLSKCFFPPIQSGFEALCELVKDDAVQVIPDDNDVNIIANLSSLLLEIRESAGYNEDSTIAKTKEMLRLIITDNQMNLSSLIRNEEVARFVADATVFLSVKGQLQIPLVLPTELELLGSKLLSNLRDEFRLPNDLEIRFLLQLLHVFEYLDQEPKSPFAFDPRTSPIKEALYMSKAISGWKRHFLDLRLQDHVLKHCPEIFSQAQRLELPTGEVTWALFHSMTRREVMDSLHATIRSFAESWQPDEADYSIEGIFLQAKARLSDADLCSTVVSSLLTSPHKPSPSYTYPLLCRDPLILFKCPVKVWKCKGLRRIVLAILCSLLDSNAEIIRSSSPLDDSSEELIAARNAMVVRCLLVAMSGVDGGVSGSYCSMTISVIRSLVSENYGLVALLIKQSLPEKALDWLVEFVPETMNDSRELLQMLSARSSLTTAERLVAADAVLRIAIVHGHSKEMEAATMAYTALAQLIDSFFLVVGPVGVPVNALMADDSGLDVTQISRKAAFRILRSLLRVRGRRARLRQECSMALQKLVTLCKGESAVAGVAGAVAGRRKTFLKEIFDAAVKASNAMGCTLGSQSAAA